ncbi:hypothetical protein QAD02_021936 [Eretmocerus hayati]|uniref:Uncharacterized protein n=1 Tax=Eretmocerus hayati TaxID=131215 RepID=A0ACC2PUU6_9HYME|nr:hypothetical protein QAD02_021936 [Eretmocerus hayati]
MSRCEERCQTTNQDAPALELPSDRAANSYNVITDESAKIRSSVCRMLNRAKDGTGQLPDEIARLRAQKGTLSQITESTRRRRCRRHDRQLTQRTLTLGGHRPAPRDDRSLGIVDAVAGRDSDTVLLRNLSLPAWPLSSETGC